jgi:hypothetical protein
LAALIGFFPNLIYFIISLAKKSQRLRPPSVPAAKNQKGLLLLKPTAFKGNK